MNKKQKNKKQIGVVAAAALAVLCSGMAIGSMANVSASAETNYDFTMLSGASVRTDDEIALRFVTRMKRTDLTAILTAKSAEMSDVNIVTMITPTDYLNEKGWATFNRENVYFPEDATKDTENDVLAQNVVMPASGYVVNALNIHETDLTVNTDDYYYYNAVLYNVAEANITRNYSARSYLEVKGEILDYTDFSYEKNSRNIWEVAAAALADPDRGFDEDSDAYKNVSALCASYEVTVNSTLNTTVIGTTYSSEEYLPSKTLTVKRGQNMRNVISEINQEGWAYTYDLYDETDTKIDINAVVTKDMTLTAKFANALVFTLNDDGESYTVASHGNVATHTTKIKIPATYNGKPITAIASTNAFSVNTHDKLANVTVMDLGDTSITEISGSNTFYNMAALETVILPKALTNIARKNFELAEGNLCADICVNGTADGHTLTIVDEKNGDMPNATVYYYNEAAVCGNTWKYDANGNVVKSIVEHNYVDGVCSICNDTAGLTYTYYSGFNGYVLTAIDPNVTQVNVASEYNDGTNGKAPVVGWHIQALQANSNKAKITSIVMPASIKSIVGNDTHKSNIFMGCTSLEYLKLSPNVDLDYYYVEDGTKPTQNSTMNNSFLDVVDLTIVIPEVAEEDTFNFGRKSFYTDGNRSGSATIYYEGTDASDIVVEDNNNSTDYYAIYTYSETPSCGYWSYDENDMPVYTAHEWVDGVCTVCGGYQTTGMTYTYNSAFSGYVLTSTGGATTVYIAGKYNDGTNGELSVVGVHIAAFKKNTTVQKIYMPSSIKYVVGNSTYSDSLFLGCTSLTYIKLSPNMDIDYCYSETDGTKLSVNTMPNTFYNDKLITVVVPEIAEGDTFNFARKSFYSTEGLFVTICYEGTDASDIVVQNDGNNSTDYYAIYTYSETAAENTWRYVDGVATVWTAEEIAAAVA